MSAALPRRYRISPFSNTVARALRRIHPVQERRIRDRIETLTDNPRPAGCLQLYEDVYRIRIGDYRVIYKVDDEQLLVEIGQIEHRGEGTYREVRRLF